MQRYSVHALLVLVLMSAFWAYTIADTLIRELSTRVTFVDIASERAVVVG
jgi:hypothetical protein